MINNIKLRIKINTLETELDKLENIIKNNLYDLFLDRDQLVESIDILTKENCRLRKKIKELKKNGNRSNSCKKHYARS